MSVLWRLPEVGPALLKHALGYADLAGAAAAELLSSTRSRAVGLVSALLAGVAAAAIASAWFALWAWSQPSRHWILAGAVAVLALIAVLLAQRSLREPVRGQHLVALREELAQDRDWLEQYHSEHRSGATHG